MISLDGYQINNSFVKLLNLSIFETNQMIIANNLNIQLRKSNFSNLKPYHSVFTLAMSKFLLKKEFLWKFL